MPYIGAGIQKFNTADSLTVNGDAEVTGTVNPSGDTASGDAAAVGFTSAEGLILTGQGSTSDITVKNDADAVVFSVPTGTDDILFPDNAKAIFGAGSDLELSHNGTDSIIEGKTGDLILRTAGTESIFLQDAGGNNLAQFNDNSDVKLYHNANEKLATTSGGVSVTGDLTVDTDTLHVDADNNRVSINSSSSAKLTVASADSGVTPNTTGDEALFEGSGNSGITIGSGASQNGSVYFGRSTDATAGRVRYDHSSNTLMFGTNGVNNRVSILSGGGIAFNGDTAAANALDDYEEGLSDVTVAPNTSGSITLYGSTNQLAYTKIGRLVHVQCELQVQAVSSPVGTFITVSGLPFNIGAVGDLGERFGGAALFHPGGGSASVKPLFGFSGTSFQIFVDASTTTVNTSIDFTFSYLT